MLAVGQALQIAGLAMLSALDPGWTAAASVAWVVVAQGIAGLAKDFTKTASKTAIKATSAEGSGQLFKWVAYFTGSKNAMKGIGFFVGGLLLDVMGFKPALWLMAARDRRHLPVGPDAAAAPARQGEGIEDGARILRQVARRQPAGGGARLPVRRARGLVRRRAAGVPLRGWLALRRGRRLPRRLDDRLRHDPGGGTCPGRAQRRWPQPRGAQRTAVGRPA